ncbi:MAG: cation diffusion facilitator family transporter [Candidatus Neomarinimicrobiota bacterium]
MKTVPAPRQTLLIAAALLMGTFLAELIGGIAFNSLSLISDSFHVISDLISILVAFLSLTIAHRKQPSRQMAFGYHRLEVMSALFNGLLLSVISALIFAEAWSRFRNPAPIDTTGALIVAGIGLAVNFTVAVLFQRISRHSKKDINIQAAYLHVLGDILASVSVVVGIVAIKLFDTPVVDPIVAGFVALLILIAAGRVLYRSAEILLHKSPQDVDRLRGRVLDVEGVKDFVDVRLWQVCSHLTVGTAHVVVSVGTVEETEGIKRQIRSIVQDEFDVRDITLECETSDMSTRHNHAFEHEHT